MENSDDVDLEKMFSESAGDTPALASEQNGSTQTAREGVTTPESERENARVRDLANEVAILKAQLADRSTSIESNTKERSVAQPTDLESLLETRVQDPGSREVLREMAAMLTKNIESKYAPQLSEVEQDRNERQFESLAASIPALAPFKAEVMKSLQNKPGTSLKSLVGEILIDKQLSKIKPTETQGSTVSREAPDLEGMELDELYDLLGAK